ncbi:hypothetical protein RFI_04687, partial [Reticulomyxa filosa]
MTQFWKIQEHLVLMIARFRKTKLDNYDAVQRMTADKNAKKARTDDAKSLKALKERKEQLKQDKAALEKRRLKREKQSESDDDDENAAQQGEKPTVDKDTICKQSSSSGGNNRPSMNRLKMKTTTINIVMQLSQNKSNNNVGSIGNSSNGTGSNRVCSDGMKKKKKVDKDAFERSCYNENSRHVFNTLRSATKKLLKDDERYRILDTTNPKVEEPFLGYEGVIDFLLLLIFDSDVMGQRLFCKEKPDQEVIRTSIR